MRPLKNLDVEGGAIQASGWSPDGRYLSGAIISKTSSAAIGVAVYDMAAQKTIKLTDDPGQWSVPFLPDSKRVIYLTPGSQLVVVDIANGKRRVVPVTLGTGVASESFAVAPDGKTLFFGAQRVEANVWKVTRPR